MSIPILTITAALQRTNGSKLVDISYTGTDAGNHNNNLITYQYSLDNSAWASMTPRSGDSTHSGVSSLLFTSGGANFGFVWDAMLDLGFNTEDPTVWVRLKSNDGSADSNLDTYQIEPNGIDTKPPVISSFIIDPVSEDEDGVTTDGTVNLNISCIGIDQMRFSVDMEKNASTKPWQEYYTLNDGKIVSGSNTLEQGKQLRPFVAGDIGKTITFVLNSNVYSYVVASIVNSWKVTLTGFTADTTTGFSLNWNIATWSSWETYSTLKNGFDTKSATYGGNSTAWLKRIAIQTKDTFGNLTNGTMSDITWYKTSAKGIKNLTNSNTYHHYKNALALASASDILEIQDSIDYPSGYRLQSGAGTLQTKIGANPVIKITFEGALKDVAPPNHIFLINSQSSIKFKNLTFKFRDFSSVALLNSFAVVEKCKFLPDTSASGECRVQMPLAKKCFFNWDGLVGSAGWTSLAFLSDYNGVDGPSRVACLLENSIINCATNSGISLGFFIFSDPTKIVKATNNTIRNAVIKNFYNNASTVNFKNNIIVNSSITKQTNVTYNFSNNNLYNVTYSGLSSPVGSNGNINQDPLFVGGSNSNPQSFKLQSNSPCVDVGTLTDMPVDDYNDYPRPQDIDPDMGAFEHPPLLCWNFTARYKDSTRLYMANGGGKYPSELRVPKSVDLSTGNMVDEGQLIDPNNYKIVQ